MELNRRVWQPVVLALSVGVVLAACSASTDSTLSDPTTSDATSTGPSLTDPTMSTAVSAPAPAVAAVPTSPIESAPGITSIPETVSSSPSTKVSPCDQTDGVITTSSGRRITLRAAGLSSASPTILVLHGYTGTPTGIERVAELTEVANAAGIAVAYPEGTATSQGGFGWNSGARVFATSGVDDVTALREMIEAVIASGCVDAARITLSGESNGAGMTLTALCAPEVRSLLRSAVLVIPAVDDGVLARCVTSGVPLPLSVVAGGLDRTAPFDGGNGLLPQRAWFDTIATSTQRCLSVGPSVALSGNAELWAGDGCGACTELIAVADGTHTWPGTSVGSGGLTSGDFDLNRRIIADLLASESVCLSSR